MTATLINGEVQKRFVSINNRRKAVWFYRDGAEVWMAFAGQENFQHLVVHDQNSYQFTHGGELYKAACRRCWELYG